MPLRTSNGTVGGLEASLASWSGGVDPVDGDKVTIASTDTITLDGNHVGGNDTTTGVVVNGTFKASRSVNSQLTARGSITSPTGYSRWGHRRGNKR